MTSKKQVMNHEALSAAVLAAVIDPTMVIGEDGVIVYFNEAACQAFGLTSKEAVGYNVSKLMADDSHAINHDQYLKNYQKTGLKKMIGRNRSVTCKRCDDGSKWVASLSISEVTLENNRYFVGTLRDLTASLARERLFSNVIDEAIDAIFTINEKGLITLVNRSACKMFKYTEQELIGQNISILMPESHRAKHDQYIHNHLETGVKKMIGTDRTVTARRKDGSEFKCRLGLSKISTGDDGSNECTFVGLLHDLTHELAAREADARAVLADKMRKQKALFLASMSHEIRTPLNGIFGMLELLRSTDLDEVQTEWLATCSRSAQSLTTILDDILLFSRADGGGISLERVSFNIRDIVEDAVVVVSHGNTGKAAIEKNSVDLVFNVARSVPEQLIGDPTRLRQVMLIFLSNALKFTTVGHVALELSLDGVDDEDSSEDDEEESEDESDDDDNASKTSKSPDGKVMLKFEISDTGIGMSKKQLKKLFQPFTQADAGTTRQYGGTGLGLSIAKKLVSLMEGEINVESRPNRGSTFTFTSCVEVDPDSSNRVCDLHDMVSDQDLELLKGTRILSIDDNAVNTDYLVNLLKIMGCDVVGARSGVDGIELAKMAALKENPFDVLLLDFAMPTMSGLEVAELLASSQTVASTRIRVIMLGSIDVHRSIAACPHIHGFTTKPIRRQPLIRMIVEQLKIKRGILWAPHTNGPTALREQGRPRSSKHSFDDQNKNQSSPLSNDTRSMDTESTGNNSSIPPEITSSSPDPTNRTEPLNILYVEDNLINQKVIVSILSRWKCRVTTALNGIIGFEERSSHSGKNSFDIILCDLHMPSCDGFQCVEMIREWEKKNKEPPSFICAVTADASSETRDTCLESGGFDEFLSKPLRKNVLRDMVINACGADRLFLEEGPTNRRKPKTPMLHEEEKKDNFGHSSNEGTHILVVDDAPTMRLLLRTLLTGMGCTVSEASSGENAVEIVKSSLTGNSHQVEMVFCDMRMPPGIGGIETSRRIKEVHGTEHLPIIGMTADEVSNSLLEEARRAGMASLISKPLGKTQLTKFLAEYTGTIFVPSTPCDSKNGEIFDEQRAMDTCGNDKEFLKSLLHDMSNDLNSRKESLSISVQRKDCARVAEIAHNIKGMAAVCSFTKLANVACDCQKSAALSDYIGVRSKSQVVMDEIANAIQVAETFE